jgi:hypothetical protein
LSAPAQVAELHHRSQAPAQVAEPHHRSQETSVRSLREGVCGLQRVRAVLKVCLFVLSVLFSLPLSRGPFFNDFSKRGSLGRFLLLLLTRSSGQAAFLPPGFFLLQELRFGSLVAPCGALRQFFFFLFSFDLARSALLLRLRLRSRITGHKLRLRLRSRITGHKKRRYVH